MNITIAGLAPEVAGMNVIVYPNPNYGKFDVKVSGFQEKAVIGLYSLTGQMIYSQEINTAQDEISTPVHIEDLASGMYLLKVTSENYVKVVRLVVE